MQNRIEEELRKVETDEVVNDLFLEAIRAKAAGDDFDVGGALLKVARAAGGSDGDDQAFVDMVGSVGLGHVATFVGIGNPESRVHCIGSFLRLLGVIAKGHEENGEDVRCGVVTTMYGLMAVDIIGRLLVITNAWIEENYGAEEARRMQDETDRLLKEALA